MTRTHKKVRHSPEGKPRNWTPISAAEGVEEALKILEGRWKLLILFHLFGGKVLRFSDLERGIPTVTQKMLARSFASSSGMASSGGSFTLKFLPKSSTA